MDFSANRRILFVGSKSNINKLNGDFKKWYDEYYNHLTGQSMKNNFEIDNQNAAKLAQRITKLIVPLTKRS